MPNMETPSALPMVRSQYMDLAQKSRRIPAWAPALCFASILIGIPFFLAIGAGIALTSIRSSDRKRLDSFYRENIVPMCLSQVFEAYEYSYEGAVHQQEVFASGIVPACTGRFTGDTYINASYKGLQLVMSNLELRGRGSDRDAVVFKGPFAVFYTDRPIEGNIWIYEKESAYMSKISAGQILTGEQEFDRRYNVFADSLEVVRQVLDFRAMNAIMEAESKLPGHIRFSFVGGRLYMAVSGGNPILSQAVAKGQHEPENIDELISRAMFEVGALVDIAEALCLGSEM